MYYDFIQQHKTTVKRAVIALVVLLVGWALITYVDHYGKVPVVVSVVPHDADVIIGGKRLGNGTHWLVAGNYTVTASKTGFDKETKKVLVTGDKKQNVVAMSLTAESQDAKKWAVSHIADYNNNQQYGAIEASSDGQYFAAKNPITTKLPYNDPYFTIGYIQNPDQSVTLTVVTPSPRYRFYAVEQIRKLGYDPTDFKIDFKDFHNPLEQKK